MEDAFQEDNFIKGAAALMRIRDGQLYREDFDSFDEYLKSILLTRREANQIVRAYKIHKSLVAFLSKAKAA